MQKIIRYEWQLDKTVCQLLKDLLILFWFTGLQVSRVETTNASFAFVIKFCINSNWQIMLHIQLMRVLAFYYMLMLLDDEDFHIQQVQRSGRFKFVELATNTFSQIHCSGVKVHYSEGRLRPTCDSQNSLGLVVKKK